MTARRKSNLRRAALPILALVVATTALGACVAYPYRPYHPGYHDRYDRRDPGHRDDRRSWDDSEHR